MKRIIAFDGLDCIGKSTVINQLKEELIRSDYIPYVFHLTSPNKLYEEFFISYNFGDLNHKVTDSIIQWSKFVELFNNIKIILSANPHNIVILDRTPYSENIWNNFFNRQNSYQNTNILKQFLQNFKDLNEEILYINLDVDNTILVNRILKKENDYKNYVNAFDSLYNKKYNNLYPNYNADDISSKIYYMINFLKEQFNKLFIELRYNNIEVKTLKNETESDINNIITTIINQL